MLLVLFSLGIPATLRGDPPGGERAAHSTWKIPSKLKKVKRWGQSPYLFCLSYWLLKCGNIMCRLGNGHCPECPLFPAPRAPPLPPGALAPTLDPLVKYLYHPSRWPSDLELRVTPHRLVERPAWWARQSCSWLLGLKPNQRQPEAVALNIICKKLHAGKVGLVFIYFL